MTLSTTEIAAVRDTAYDLLGALGLEAYLFEVEPREGEWSLKVECAAEGGWETAVLPLPRDRVLASRENPGVQSELLDEWRGRLRGCRIEPRP